MAAIFNCILGSIILILAFVFEVLQKSDTVKIDSSSQNAFRDSVLHLCNNHVSFHSEHEQVKELKTLHESCSFVTRKQPLVFLAFCAQKKLLLNVGEFMIP